MSLDRPLDEIAEQYAISAGSQLAAELAFGVGALLALVYCVHLARKERKIWPLMVWLSGAPMTLWEPMQNIVTNVVYPADGQHTAFEIYDLKMPVYLVLLYVTYFGLTVPWIMRRIEAGVTVGWLMKVYFAMVAFAAAFEPVPVHVMDWYTYYGDNQPLEFFGIPIWWFFVNAMVIVGLAIIFAALRKHVLTADWQSVAFVPAALLVCGGLHHSAGIPAYTAIGSGWSSAVTIPMSLVSCGLAVVWVYLLARLVATGATETATSRSIPTGGVSRADDLQTT
jgi:hypothetical protein